MTERRKRLIEVAFPLEEVSEHSRREKNVRHGHISTLHIWWARRPLAACRAFIYASLVNDPETDEEREELLKEVADLASWDAVRKPDIVIRPKPKGSGLTGHELLRRARERILRDNDGKPPKLLDPFAGGGAIPLEALRLGCEVEASDLNPVAVLILKGTVEYPQKYGRPLAEQREKRPEDSAGVNGQVPQYIRDLDEKGGQLPGLGGGAVDAYERNPLATDVRYWGNWMLEKARKELAQYYPPDPDGSVPVAYLWSRTVPCPNCEAEMPLVRQYWLARKDNKKIALTPVVVPQTSSVTFEVVEGSNVTGDPGHATTSRGDTTCLVCKQVVTAAYVHEAGRAGNLGQKATAVILEASGPGGKRYRAPTESDARVYEVAQVHRGKLLSETFGDLPAIPNEPLARHPQYMLVREYGLDEWGKLFNDRQIAALVGFTRIAKSATSELSAAGLPPAYMAAISTYLAIAVDRLADYNSVGTRWASHGEYVGNTFTRQALPMVWDYCEVNPFSGQTGSIESAVDWIAATLDSPIDTPSRVMMRDARVSVGKPMDGVVTDPPYYDAINYADLSDFFYVWLKRVLGDVQPDLFSLPVTPKREQAVMNVQLADPGVRSARESARQKYVSAMQQSFDAISQCVSDDGMVSVVFAHSEADAWATLIDGLLAAELVPSASWPVDTELANKVGSDSRANLKTSVWMACRPRHSDATSSFIDDIRTELRHEVEDKLLDFWRRGIRGADFFISAIGPALAVFGRHSKVLHPDGTQVTVREFLDIVRQESARVALQQVLHGENLGAVDPATRAFVMWVWSYGKAALDAGEAIAHCLATGADLGDITRPHAIAETAKDRSMKVVRLRSIAVRAREDDELGRGNGARNTPLIDELQYAAYLWGAGKAASDLPKYRATLGEERWKALRVLGQAVAECLPDGDDDRRIVLGLLGSGAASGAAPAVVPGTQSRMELG